ncbi:MAG: transporter substrate-binding domain-containing protein [Bdellovibrionales bacterium]
MFKTLLTIILSVGITLGLITFLKPSNQTQQTESVHDRILRTKKIRCGYFIYEPALIIDPNTKQMSGIFYDLTEEMARRLGLSVEWTEEVGYGEIMQGFESNRYDLFCNVIWPTPERSRAASFSLPLYYSTLGVFVRDDDHRFDGNIDKLNDPNYTVAVKDGDITASVAKAVFPKARIASIPQLALTEQQLVDVGMKKADATFNEPPLLARYNKSAAVKLRDIAKDKPVKYFPNVFMMPKGDLALKEMVDTTLKDMISEGFVERTIKKHELYPNSYRMPILPFSTQN